MLALGTAVLLENRELWNRLIADPTSAAPIVDELLRLLSVVQVSFPRFAKHDVVVAGQQISRAPWCSARSPPPTATRAPAPATRSTSSVRPPPTSRSGYGFHRCVGAELARMELRMAFPSIAARFPRCGWRCRAGSGIRALSLVYGVEAVPVTVR